MKKTTFILITFITTTVFFTSCKKDKTTITIEKVKAPAQAPVLVEIKSIVLTHMPSKTTPNATNNGDWDFNQLEETLGADLIINILDSIPYYSIYASGNIWENIKQDSLPKKFGKHSFPIRNLKEKFHLIVLDWDKNYEAEQMALIPFKMNDYSATKPTQIELFTPNHSVILTLNLIWY